MTDQPISGKGADHVEALYAQFHDKLKRFILGRISDEAVVDDLLQEVFIRIHSQINSLRDTSRVESWVYQITRNMIIDYFRSARRMERIDVLEDIAGEEERQDVPSELAAGLRELVDKLPEPYREAIILTEFEGISQKELARRLGLSFSGAKSRVQRARSMLKDMLMRCCHFEFDRYGTVLDYHEISCCCCQESAAKC